MEKSEQISVGVVGTGGMGGLHAGILQDEVANARLAAVADLDTERAEKIAEKSGAAVFTDAEEMIQDENIDAVLVASPDPTHAPLVKECLKLEKPVLCEKPLADSAEARRRGLGRAVGSVLNHRRAYGLHRDERGLALWLRGGRGGCLRAGHRSDRATGRGDRAPGPRRFQTDNGGLVRQVPHRLRNRGPGVDRVRQQRDTDWLGCVGRIRFSGRRRRLSRLAALRVSREGDEVGPAGTLQGDRGGGAMNHGLSVAGAPISWGVIELPNWGYQMPADRLLREAASIGLTAMEAGPEEFLSQDPGEVRELLAEHDLGLVGGFVPAVLHDSQARQEGLDLVERRAGVFF